MCHNVKESETLEFKKSITQLKKAIISIVAILNKHKKGKIVFGIKDNGDVIGVDIGKTTLRDISKAISDFIEPKIYPEIKEEIINEKKCIVINFSGKNIPYFAYGRAYKRVSDENKVLTKRELEEMILNNNRNKLRWDNQLNEEFSLNDISDTKLRKYISIIGLKYISKKDSLKKLNLMKQNKLTNASLILFGKDVRKIFGLLNLRCAVFPGLEKAQGYIDAKDYYGDLFELIDFAEKYILEHINIGMRIEGLRRVDVPEIHPEAIREAIINAFCHRDYTIPQEVQIAIFKDRIEILNPGKLYGGLEIKDIVSKSVSERRNELIADIFHKIHYIEKWGLGIGKILKLEPETKFEEVGDFFMVTFKRKNVPKNVPKNVSKNSAERQEIILEKVRKGIRFTREDLALEFNVSTKTIQRDLDKLKDKIEFKGSKKTGKWVLKNE